MEHPWEVHFLKLVLSIKTLEVVVEVFKELKEGATEVVVETHTNNNSSRRLIQIEAEEEVHLITLEGALNMKEVVAWDVHRTNLMITQGNLEEGEDKEEELEVLPIINPFHSNKKCRINLKLGKRINSNTHLPLKINIEGSREACLLVFVDQCILKVVET